MASGRTRHIYQPFRSLGRVKERLKVRVPVRARILSQKISLIRSKSLSNRWGPFLTAAKKNTFSDYNVGRLSQIRMP